jgi:3-methyladenine DNA glycosylase AlkD
VSGGEAGAITVEEVLSEIRSHRDEEATAGMARFGITVDDAVGMAVPEIRALAKRIVTQLGKSNPARHEFAAGLWAAGIHEARLLAGMVDMAEAVTLEQMESWVLDLDSWDVCDQLCMNLFAETPLAWGKAVEWTAREEEFVKRAGFALIAVLAWRDKKASDDSFVPMLAAIEREAGDDRNFVKKAVNWALRQIGKRSPTLNAAAVETARRIAGQGSKPARWIATDALRELEGEAVKKRLGLV